MSVFKAMAKIQTYLKHCPTEDIRKEAKNDIASGIKEIMKEGYTWGRTHEIPFEYRDLSESELKQLLNFVKK